MKKLLLTIVLLMLSAAIVYAQPASAKTLVVYNSWSGNTKLLIV